MQSTQCLLAECAIPMIGVVMMMDNPEKRSYKGYWWLPEQPTRLVPGVLIVDPLKDAQLELWGVLVHEHVSQSGRRDQRLLGITTDGTRVTLQDYLVRETTISTGGLGVQTLYANVVCAGFCFESPEHIALDTVSIRYANLEAWMDNRSFSNSTVSSSEQGVEYVKPESIVIATETLEVMLFSGFHHSFGQIHQHLEERCSIRVRPMDGRLTLADIVKVTHRMRGFLTLAMGSSAAPITITGHLQFQSNEETARQIDVDIHYPIIKPQAELREMHGHEMLFTLRNVGDRIYSMIPRWLSIAEELEPIVNLYFSALYNPFLYTENEFLALVQGAETYHRVRIGGKYVSDDDYETGLYQALVDTLPPDMDRGFRDSLVQGKLRYAHEFSLRKRLTQLAQRLASLEVPIFGDKGAAQAFVTTVCNTRNYLTH